MPYTQQRGGANGGAKPPAAAPAAGPSSTPPNQGSTGPSGGNRRASGRDRRPSISGALDSKFIESYGSTVGAGADAGKGVAPGARESAGTEKPRGSMRRGQTQDALKEVNLSQVPPPPPQAP